MKTKSAVRPREIQRTVLNLERSELGVRRVEDCVVQHTIATNRTRLPRLFGGFELPGQIHQLAGAVGRRNRDGDGSGGNVLRERVDLVRAHVRDVRWLSAYRYAHLIEHGRHSIVHDRVRPRVRNRRKIYTLNREPRIRHNAGLKTARTENAGIRCDERYQSRKDRGGIAGARTR